MTEPSIEELGGNHPVTVVRRFFLATRPKFFGASVLPVALGTVLGAHSANGLDMLATMLAVGATVLVHAAANVLNDVFDDRSGTDAGNTDRIYPYTGGSRFIQNRVIDAAAMARLGWGLLVAGLAVGGVLAILKGAMVIVFGLTGVGLGILYSTPPVWLSARGLGETAVGLAFGILPVVGGAWLQTGCYALGAPVGLLSLPVAFWIANVLLINEVPDMAADAAVGRRTLAVRLGWPRTAALYFGLCALAAISVAAAGILAVVPLWAAAVPAILLWPAATAARAIRFFRERPDGMKQGIKRTRGIHAIGTTWLIGVLLMSR